jgi:acetyl-CoA carboxylase biotin carboxyl carrier protein
LVDIEKIRQLIEMMVDNELSELSLKDGEEEVNLRRGTAPSVPVAAPVAPAVAPAPAAPPTADAPPAAEDDPNLVAITSPMVGTFYRSPTPESPAFVQPGSVVSPESVVCIVEAMKVFNEIKSEISGTIEQVLVENEAAIEFGQPLFLVRTK